MNKRVTITNNYRRFTIEYFYIHQYKWNIKLFHNYPWLFKVKKSYISMLLKFKKIFILYFPWLFKAKKFIFHRIFKL